MKLIPTMLKVTSIITVLFFAAGAQAAIVTTGDINPADPATWTTSAPGTVGNTSDGTMEINSGSSVSSSSGYLGYNNSVAGAVTVTGAGSTWTSVNDFMVGRSGTGTLSLLDDGVISNANGTIGWLAGSTGTVTVDNGTWTNSAGLTVGMQGTGALNIISGGAVSSTDGRVGGYTSTDHGVGTVTVNGTGSTWTNTNSLSVGIYGTGTLNIINGGAVSSAGGVLGSGSTGSGAVEVTGAGSSWASSGGITVGSEGSGTLTIADSGAINSTSVTIGSLAAGAATITGAGSTWTSSGAVNVGYHGTGTGTLTIADGGLLSSASGSIGRNLGGSGSVTVNNGTWTNSGDLFVGNDGSGTLIIENGGTVTSGFATISRTGRLAGSSGTATVTGAGSSWASSDDLVIGGTAGGGTTATNGLGDGTLHILAGGAVSNVDGYIGSDTDAIGAVNISGTGSIWTNADDLIIGRNGTGTLTVTNSGTVSNDTGTIGDSSSSNGTATIDGVGSSWTNSYLIIGDEGTGSLHISNGGRVTSDNGVSIGANSTGIGSITVNGSGSQLTTDSAGYNWFYVGDYGDGSLTISNGGVVNSSTSIIGNSPGAGAAMVTGSGSQWTNTGELVIGFGSSGDLTIANGGTVSSADGLVGYGSGSIGAVTVTGTASTWTNSGDLYVGDSGGSGTLNISSGGEVVAATADIGTNGRLSGDGLMTLGSGAGTLINDGTISPGNSIGTLTVDGHVVFENGSTFEVEIDNAGNSDLLDVTGDVTINSGSTVAINSNGETITDGKHYTLIEAGGSISGEFDILDTALVTWDAAVTTYEMVYDTTTAALVVGVPSVDPFDTPTLLSTYNQLVVGHAVEQISTAGGTLGGITAALQGIVAEDDFRYAYDQLSGQTRPSLAPIANAGVSNFANAILTRIHNSQSVEIDTNDHEYYFWVKGFGNFGDRDSKDGVNGSDYDIVGVATGLDYQINPDFRAGVSLGLSDTDVEYDDTRDSSRIDSFYGALYGTYRGFDGYIDALLTYAYLDNETDRYVDFVSEKNEGNFDGYEILATVEAAKNYSFKSILIQPLLGFELGYQRQDGYTETGGSSALRYDDQSFESYKGSLGVKGSKYFYKNDRQSLWGQLQAKWTHEFGDTAADIDVSFASTPGYRFTIKDGKMDRDSAILGTGVKYEPSKNTLLFVDYDVLINNDTFAHILNGGIRLAF